MGFFLIKYFNKMVNKGVLVIEIIVLIVILVLFIEV